MYYNNIHVCIYRFLVGFIGPGMYLLVPFCLPCPYIKKSPLRSSDQSSVLFHCDCFVLFWLAILSCVALVHKLEQSIITEALHASL